MNDLVPLRFPDPGSGAAAAPRPPLLRSALLRFGFCYWVLFCLVQSDQASGLEWLGNLVHRAWYPLVGWVARNVLGISHELFLGPSGSGDKTVDWIGLLCMAGLAGLATILWIALGRTRPPDARLRELLRIGIRYFLAFVLLGYGLGKVLLLQFPAPDAGRLAQRYGDSSPMGLLWTLMGSSPTYQFFSGAGELVGAVLLLFRRTTTLGALILGGVLLNVVMLNFSYDVCVKINSSHYLAMCIFLIGPDLGRLASVLLFNRPTRAVAQDLVLPRRWMRIARHAVKGCVIVGLSVPLVVGSVEAYREVSNPGPAAWYEGYWATTRFTRNGQDVPAIVTDKTRWLRVRFQRWSDQIMLFRWRFMDDSRGDLYQVTVDEQAQTFRLTSSDISGPPTHPVPPVTLRYTRLDADHLQLETQIDGATVSAQLERWDPGTMLLVSRGFHWITERAFNR